MNTPKPPAGVNLIVGAEALSKLIDIWMGGVGTGIASAFATAGFTDDRVHELSQQMVNEMRDDPAAMLLAEDQVREHVLGIYTGIKTLEVYRPEEDR